MGTLLLAWITASESVSSSCAFKALLTVLAPSLAASKEIPHDEVASCGKSSGRAQSRGLWQGSGRFYVEGAASLVEEDPWDDV